jgi:hypothetical protein
VACSASVQIYIKFGARESICYKGLKELYNTDFRPLFADSAITLSHFENALFTDCSTRVVEHNGTLLDQV